MVTSIRTLARTALAVGLVTASLAAQGAFVNFESPHVSPLALTPNGSRLLAVNTAANRLEVWNAEGAALLPLRSIPVGLDPVSVRAHDDTTAWVVNHVSDSVSVVDLVLGRVVATLDTGDEPCDVVFAGTSGTGGGPQAFVSCSAIDTIQVFDPGDLSAAPIDVPVAGEEPRMLAVSPDGALVFAALFESGNGSTVLGGGPTAGTSFPPDVVSLPGTPHAGQNPPFNDGAGFDPPLLEPDPPSVALIVRKDAAGVWRDDTGADWTPWVSGAQAPVSGRPVGWDLPDHDVAVLSADSLALGYVDRLMTVDMALAVHPGDGRVAVVGTEATNEIRFEPNLTGTFVRAHLALVALGGSDIVDLNPHLDYSTGTVGQALRDQSLGDPRGAAWSADGARLYVTGMGSDNLVVLDSDGERAGLTPTIETGAGPTGVVVQDSHDRLFVLNRFDGSISVIDTLGESETARVPFFDPTPGAIRDGRAFLYDTHLTSGLGQVSCGSCHVDARFDRLAWDLGDPSGTSMPVTGQNQGAGLIVGSFPRWHPMKGPMTTQTLQDIVGKEPHHWRGDRTGLEAFNGAFVGLLGDDTMLTADEMQRFEDFLATLTFPPNPFRELDNTLSTDVPLDGHYTTGRFGPAGQPLGSGDAQRGLQLFRPPTILDTQGVACVTCHNLPVGIAPDYSLVGAEYQPFPVGPDGEHHHALVTANMGAASVTIKVPQLRNLYDKVGMEFQLGENTAGFGFLHDGSVDSLARFVSEPIFAVTSDQDVADLVAFLLSFSGSDLPQGSTTTLLEPPGTASQDTHAAVGVQQTLVGGDGPGATALVDALEGLADGGQVGLVAHGYRGGLFRGYAYAGASTWQSDRAGETVTSAALRTDLGPGQELTFTATPWGSEVRLGVDADGDGALDRDELDAGSDPGDANSLPGACTPAGTDLGYAKPGGDGRFPVLRACGSLDSGQTADLLLLDARANTPAWLVFSLAAGLLPYSGGTLVPLPDFLLGPVPTNGDGAIGVPGIGGGGGPVDLYVQWVILDPTAPGGRALSNGLALHFGP